MTPALLTQKELRLLQAVFLILILIGIGMRSLSGGTAVEVIVGGGTLGGLLFVPIALLYLVYLFGNRSKK